MSYRVHRFVVNKEIQAAALEDFLNGLRGEVISILPELVPKFHIMGATAGYDHLIIVEKTKQ